MSESARLRFIWLGGSLLLLAAYLHAGTAYAAPGDPPRGSPAGSVYKLPLEGGRQDASPKGGGNGAAAGGGSADSLYRSENNFGSSSQVPGATAAGVAAAGAGVAGAQDGGGDGEGTGGGGAVGGPDGDGDGKPDTVEAEVADAGNTSVAAGIGLLGAIGLLALAAGVLTRRFGQP